MPVIETSVLDMSNISRDNIKQNTKNLICEISDIDMEIAQLQGTLLSALQPNIQTSAEAVSGYSQLPTLQMGMQEVGADIED